MAIISHKTENEYRLSKSFENFVKTYEIPELLKRSNVKKEKGISAGVVFSMLLTVVFLGKSLNRLISEGQIRVKKDVFYRFVNSVHTNWSKFMTLLSSKAIEKIMPLTSEKRINTLILDDSIFKRNRSKNVELLTRVQDHSDMKFYRGLRCLTLGWSDGNTFVPVGFNLLSSANEKTRINGFCKDIDKRTNGYKRRCGAIMSTYDAAVELVKNAVAPATHVLFDSWFAEIKMFNNLRKLGYHGIGVLKAKKGRCFTWKGKYLNLENLYARVSRRIPKEDDKTSVIVKTNSGTKLKIVFVRSSHKTRDWLAIATTDLSLRNDEIITLYARRWDIEVFFKTVKSHLGFAKEFSGRSYDMMCAEVAIVFTRYIMLAVTVRNETDMRTAGDLFFFVYDELREFSLVEALLIIMEYFEETIDKFVNSRRIDAAKSFFFSVLPAWFKDFFAVYCCES